MDKTSVGSSTPAESTGDVANRSGREIRIRGLSKSFGSQKSLIDVDLDIRPGELLGLMGPNGAGKSTLIKILDGVYSRDAGTIEIDGHPVRVLGSQPSVAFIHQDLGLIDGLSISANLQLGQRAVGSVGPFLDFKAERAYARQALETVHLNLDVDQFVGELSPGEKTLVAIARAISGGANVLFVDEATSTLPTVDAHRVTASLKLAAADGATIVMVSHKLNEILETTARVVLLVDGRIVADRPTDGLDIDSLTELLVGHGLAEHVENGSSKPGETLIKLEDVHCGAAGPANFEVRRGEIVGLTGLSGSGLYDLANVAHGSLKADRGRVTVGDRCRRSLLPPHRETQGGFDELTGRENLTVASMKRWRGRDLLLRRRAEQRACDDIYSDLSIRPANSEVTYGVLSGGNKQKILIGRLLLEQPDLYVLCEPTRGVDVSTRHEIYSIIRRLGRTRAGILIISSDAEDLLAVCDRIGVIADGHVAEPVALSELDSEARKAMV